MVAKTGFLWFGKTSSFQFSPHHLYKGLTLVIRQFASTLTKIPNQNRCQTDPDHKRTQLTFLTREQPSPASVLFCFYLFSIISQQ